MADPIGNLFRELAAATIGYRAGKTKEQLRELKAELRKDGIDHLANKVYARLLAKLAGADLVSTHPLFTGKAFALRELIGMGPIAQFALEVSEFVRK